MKRAPKLPPGQGALTEIDAHEAEDAFPHGLVREHAAQISFRVRTRGVELNHLAEIEVGEPVEEHGSSKAIAVLAA